MPSLKHAIALVVFFVAAPCALADTLTLSYTVHFGTDPVVGHPHLTAVFEDAGLDKVKLTMTVGPIGEADVTEIYFNLVPSLDPTDLGFSRLNGTGPTAAETSIFTGADLFPADGDGEYDVLFDLPPPSTSANAARFNAGESLVYEITGISGLTASSFNVLANPAGGVGPFLSAAKFQSTGPSPFGGSDWVGAVPEPTNVISVIAMVVASAVFLGMKRRRETSVETQL